MFIGLNIYTTLTPVGGVELTSTVTYQREFRSSDRREKIFS